MGMERSRRTRSGLRFLGLFDGVEGVGGFAADFDVGDVLEESADDIADADAVVGDQDLLHFGIA